MSFYEFKLQYDDYFDRQEREWNEKVTHALIAAYFHRVDKFNWKLKDGFMWAELMRSTKKADTPETMLSLVQRLNAQFGGNVV